MYLVRSVSVLQLRVYQRIVRCRRFCPSVRETPVQRFLLILSRRPDNVSEELDDRRYGVYWAASNRFHWLQKRAWKNGKQLTERRFDTDWNFVCSCRRCWVHFLGHDVNGRAEQVSFKIRQRHLPLSSRGDRFSRTITRHRPSNFAD